MLQILKIIIFRFLIFLRLSSEIYKKLLIFCLLIISIIISQCNDANNTEKISDDQLVSNENINEDVVTPTKAYSTICNLCNQEYVDDGDRIETRNYHWTDYYYDGNNKCRDYVYKKYRVYFEIYRGRCFEDEDWEICLLKTGEDYLGEFVDKTECCDRRPCKPNTCVECSLNTCPD